MLFCLLLVSVLALPALIPITPAHFFASSDGLYHVHRGIEIDRCLRDGLLICRWAPDQFLGYGTPLFNFYSPLTYYLAAAFHAIGFGWLAATKAVIAVFMVLSAVGALLYASTFLSLNAATMAAVVYVYVPYHLINAYYRGDIPEFAAMAWFPILLWSFSRLAEARPARIQGRYLLAAALSYAGLVLTHNLSAFIFTPILVLYCLWLAGRAALEEGGGLKTAVFSASRLVAAALLAFGLCAVLALPALLEKEFVQLKGLLYVSHTDHFPALKDILPNTIIHTYGIIFPDSPVYAYKMGLVQVALGGAGALAGLVLFRRFRARARTELLMAVLIFAIAMYFAQPISLPAWSTIPLLPLTQFPWRFLLLMALPTSIATGYIVDVLSPRWRLPTSISLIAFCLVTNLLGLRPIMANVQDPEVGVRETLEFELLYHLVGTTVAGEYVPAWVKDYPWVSPEALARVVGGREERPYHQMASDPWISVDTLAERTGQASYRLNAERPSHLVLNIAYFPGWEAWLDDSPVTIEASEPEGLIALTVPAGQHSLRVAFGNTPLRATSDAISLVALLLALGLGVWAFWPAGRRILAWRPDRRTAWAAGLLAALLALVPLGALRYAAAYQPPPVAHYPLKINLADTLMLLGYDLLVDQRPLGRGETVTPGTDLTLRLYWRPVDPRQADRAVRTEAYARLSNIDEQNWAFAREIAREPAGGEDVFRSLLQLSVPPGLAPGVYQVDVGALSRDGRPLGVRNMELVELLPTQGSIRLGPLYVAPGGPAEAGLAHPTEHNFNGRARLEGFSLTRGLSSRRPTPQPIVPAATDPAPQLAAGDVLQIDLAWRALTSTPGLYFINATLEDTQGFKWAVREAEPVDRMYPTWLWRQGDLVRDQLRMPIPAETPPGTYRLALRVLDQGRPLNVLDPNGNPAGATAMLADVALAKAEVPPRDREIQIANRERIRLTDDVEVIGTAVGRTELSPGEHVDLELIWRALKDIRRDYQVRLGLEARDGRRWGEVMVRPAGEANPTSRWEERDTFRGQYRITARPGAGTGTAQLILELQDTATGRVESRKELARLEVMGRDGRSQPAARPDHQLEARFGESIFLRGYSLEPGSTVRLGRDQALKVTLFWEAAGTPDHSYTVFTQLLDANGKLATQHDGPPAEGTSPTSGWLAGDVVADVHEIPIPRSLSPGEYRLITGLYDPTTGQRLVVGPENFADVTRVQIIQP